MSSPTVDQATIDTLNAPHTPKCVLLTTGGGLGVFGTLSRQGGASHTLLEGTIPYSMRAPEPWIGKVRSGACSAEVALRYASAAFQHALSIRDSDEQIVFGVGSTSSLAKREAEREGRRHHAYTALQTRDMTILFTCHYPAGLTRLQEELHVERTLLAAVALGKGQEAPFLPTDVETVKATAEECGHPLLPELLEGKLPYIAYQLGNGQLTALAGKINADYCALFSGSWNPRHEAHMTIYQILKKYSYKVPDWEIGANADKGGLDYITIKNRIAQFKGDTEGRLFVTGLPFFVDKSEHFTNCMFAVGWDTMSRILEPERYGKGTAKDFHEVLNSLRDSGNEFLVFGCHDEKGKFENVNTKKFENLFVQEWVNMMTTAVPEKEFSYNLRSSSLRKTD